MNNRRRTERIHSLHEVLLHRFELEQANVFARLSEERALLAEIRQSQDEAEVVGGRGHSGDDGSVMAGWQARAWGEYREALAHRAAVQLDVIAHWQNMWELARQRTQEAYTDAKRWDNLASRLRKTAEEAASRSELRAADELAVTTRAAAAQSRGMDAL